MRRLCNELNNQIGGDEFKKSEFDNVLSKVDEKKENKAAAAATKALHIWTRQVIRLKFKS